jgi:hypothetical protein
MDGPLCVLADASRQYQALLEVSQSVASHRDLTALFQDLVECLPRVLSFDSLWLVLHDPARNRMRLHVLEGPAREAAEESAWPLERPMEESPSALAWSTQEPLVVFNLADDPRYRAAFRLSLDNGVRSCCILPPTTAHRRLSAVGFGYARPRNYSGEDVEFLGQVARQSPWQWTMFWRMRKLANLQPHNASPEMTFYDGGQFPAEYRGDVFAGEHGSWRKAVRTGYEVTRGPAGCLNVVAKAAACSRARLSKSSEIDAPVSEP